MSLRSPLGRVLGSGSAKDGTEHWWMQRVTAVGVLLLGGWFLYSLVRLPGFSHAQVVAWAGQPLNGILLVLLSVTLVWHSMLGVQVVIEDYVHGPAVKVFSLVLNKFAHVFLAGAAVFSILLIALRGQL